MNRHEKRVAKAQGRWLPLARAKAVPRTDAQIQESFEDARRTCPDVTLEQVRDMVEEQAQNEVWMNDRYVVHVIRWAGGPDGAAIVQLSIRRRDRGPARDWRDFQRIKNQLVGPQCEGVELYPAESRLMDAANQFHVWCIDDALYRFPVGFTGPRVVTSDTGAGAVQRPIDEEAA